MRLANADCATQTAPRRASKLRSLASACNVCPVRTLQRDTNARLVAAHVRLLARVKLEEDRERDLIFEPALLQSAALLFDDEP